MNNGIPMDAISDLLIEACAIGREGVPLDFKHFKASVVRDMEQHCGKPLPSGLPERIDRYCSMLEGAYHAGCREAAEEVVGQ